MTDRMMKVETELATIKKLLYGVLLILAGHFGITVLPTVVASLG